MLLSEIRRGLEEQKKVKEDVRRICLAMNRLEDSIKHRRDDTLRKIVSIDTRQYKVG